jgi:Uroporphyrinogen decarboxylase (URO-D)
MVNPLLARNAASSDSANRRWSIRLFAYRHPEACAKFIDILVDASANYLVRQFAAGVDSIQIFDTWSGILPVRFSDRPRFISVTTTATPVFLYNLQSDNTCLFPAHVRFLLQEKDDDLSGMNGKQYFRWFSNSVAHQLAPGTANPSASLTDLSQMDERIWRKSKCKCRRNGRF